MRGPAPGTHGRQEAEAWVVDHGLLILLPRKGFHVGFVFSFSRKILAVYGTNGIGIISPAGDSVSFCARQNIPSTA